LTTQGYVSKTDLVAALIRELVITGELAAGEQLRQRDLAQRFGVSQTPVREAMRRLESEGLLVCDTHRGFTVAAPELGPVEENFQIRAALESLGASLASDIAGADMAAIVTDDGVTLHAEEAGQGEPLVFIHEFAGDHRSWEPQIRFFSSAYRCVTYAARGYPPSGVPTDPAAYSQARAVADTIAVLDGLGIDRAHLVGLSMGGFTALHLVMSHPDRVLSAVVAGAGYGAQPERADAFRTESMLTAAAFAAEGAAKVAERYAVGPARVQFQNKNPRGWAEFAAALAEHSDLGSALTMRGVQAARPSLYALTEELVKVRVPVLVMVGDEDEGSLEPALMLKRTIPTAGLAVLPRTGHTANLEEPDVFNHVVDRFLAAVARDAWHPRDPRSVSDSTMGLR
jgi:pimeloyl-ACP methyl ester carboxylesterase/DNA-binding transcriptional regulator YhcF (GntR family)